MNEGKTIRLSEIVQGSELVDRLGETIPGLLYVFDLVERRNVYSNRPLASLLGYSPEEVRALGDQLLATIIHPDDVALTQAHHARIRAATESQLLELEYRVRAADGSYRWLHSWETVLSRDGAGLPHQLLGVAQDVTERVLLEEELRDGRRRLAESEQRWRSIAENPFDFVIVIDREYKYTYVNWVAPGLKEEDLLGKATPFEFVAESDHPVMQAAFDVVFKEGRPTSYEVYVPTLDRWYSSLVGPIREGDVVTHASVLTREITSEKRMQQEARRATEELHLMEAKLAQSAKLEAVGQLAGGIAHDFNNLLTGIAGVAELLTNRFGPADPSYRDVADLHEAVRRGAGLTRQLLAFSRQQPITPAVVELNEVMASMSRMLERLIGDSIELSMIEGGSPVHVRGDRTQLEQVLLNLVVNARDAMPGGGKLTVGLSVIPVDLALRQRYPDARPGAHARLTVADTGVGMDSPTIARIFEPFFTTKAIGAGTGLGLSMVYGIVRQGGGFIAVDSEPGHGTTFSVHLPLVAPTDLTRVEASSHAHGGSEAILLVEDDELVLNFTRRLLQALGYTVRVAARGDDAVRLLEAGLQLDLLLTDVLLPGIDGHALCQRAQQLRPGLPVVFMSGYTDDVFSGKALAHERSAFLQKPFTQAELAAKIRAVLDVSRTVPPPPGP